MPLHRISIPHDYKMTEIRLHWSTYDSQLLKITQMAQIGCFWPFSGQLITQFTPNVVHTIIVWVFRLEFRPHGPSSGSLVPQIYLKSMVSEQLITQLSSNLIHTVIGYIYRNSWIFYYVGSISTLWWPRNGLSVWFPTFIWRSYILIDFKLGVCSNRGPMTHCLGNGTPTALSHYLHNCWFILNWIIGNKHDWSMNQNQNYFHTKNASKIGASNMLNILLRPRWVMFTVKGWYMRL